MAAYDSNIRSPLIISQPGQIPQGSVCPSPVGGVDLVPTIFRFAGIDFPWEMHGHDLSPLLKNPKADWPHPVLLCGFLSTQASRSPNRPTSFLHVPANRIGHRRLTSGRKDPAARRYGEIARSRLGCGSIIRECSQLMRE